MRYNLELWRFVMPLFLHGGFIHLFSNVLSQLFLGFTLEKHLGPAKFALFYVLSG